jgi:hypothetical protein
VFREYFYALLSSSIYDLSCLISGAGCEKHVVRRELDIHDGVAVSSKGNVGLGEVRVLVCIQEMHPSVFIADGNH